MFRIRTRNSREGFRFLRCLHTPHLYHGTKGSNDVIPARHAATIAGFVFHLNCPTAAQLSDIVSQELTNRVDVELEASENTEHHLRCKSTRNMSSMSYSRETLKTSQTNHFGCIQSIPNLSRLICVQVFKKMIHQATASREIKTCTSFRTGMRSRIKESFCPSATPNAKTPRTETEP